MNLPSLHQRILLPSSPAASQTLPRVLLDRPSSAFIRSPPTTTTKSHSYHEDLQTEFSVFFVAVMAAAVAVPNPDAELDEDIVLRNCRISGICTKVIH